MLSVFLTTFKSFYSAWMAEPVYAQVSKTCGGNSLWVRFPLQALLLISILNGYGNNRCKQIKDGGDLRR